MFTVSGATGFLGTELVTQLQHAGLAVRAVARRPVTTVPCTVVSVASYSDLEPCSPDDVLIHLAETRDIAAAEKNGNSHLEDARSTAAALSAKGWKHIVYASSAVVYGDIEDYPRRSDEPTNAQGIYARAKLACEAEVLARQGTVARLSNLYGQGMAGSSVLSEILRQLPGRDPIVIQDPKPVRDFLHVADAARALMMLATSRLRGVYNVASGEGIAIGVLARLILEIADERDRPVQATAPLGRSSHLVLDISKTLADTGWQPQILLADGLRELVRTAA